MTVTALVEGNAFHGDTFQVEGALYRHLFRSRRLAQGASIRVVDGLGSTRSAVIHEVKSNFAILHLGDELPSWDPIVQVHLFVAPLRPERNAWLVEKATEIGVSRIQWLQTERTTRPLRPRDFERLQRVARAALVQCGGARLPRLKETCSLAEAREIAVNCPTTIALDFSGESPHSLPKGPVALFVGPEGGWTDTEKNALARSVNCLWSLGDRVLRTETAAIVSASRLLNTH